MAGNADPPAGELNESISAISTTEPTDGSLPESSATALVSDRTLEAGEEGKTPTDVEQTGTDPASQDDRRAKNAPVRLALVLGLVVVLALAGLVSMVGWRAYQSYEAQQERDLSIQVARQAALNLTTIDWQHADADVQRILDSATGSFYDDFSKRSQPFLKVVKDSQSKTAGEITESAVEAVSGDESQVLVTVKVTTSNVAVPDQAPRFWRMRLAVKKLNDDEAKVSNVTFVP